MPKKRTSTKPLRLRTRIDTTERINEELRRTYRLFINKEITHAEMSRRRELLVALRAGMADPVERPESGDFTPTTINVLSVPSGYFLSHEQIEANKRGERIINLSDCTPLLLEQDAPQPLLRIVPDHEPAPEFKPQNERERRLLAELEGLTHEQLLERAKQAGFVDTDGIRLEALVAELSRMTHDELLVLARQCGLDDKPGKPTSE